MITHALAELVELDASERHTEPDEPEFAESYSLEVRARFAGVALEMICAALEAFKAAGVMRKFKGAGDCDEIVVRKLFFAAVRPWFTLPDMAKVFNFGLRSIVRDVGEVERWAREDSDFAQLAAVVCEIAEGAPAAVLAAGRGLQAARRLQGRAVEARRADGVRRKATRAKVEALVTPETAVAVLMLARGDRLMLVHEQTGLDMKRVADLYFELAGSGALDEIRRRAETLTARGARRVVRSGP